MVYLNTKSGYGMIARMLHWSMALAVIFLFVLGYWMRTLTYASPYYQSAPKLHQSIGLILLVLLLIRFVWKLINTAPDDTDLTQMEQLGSRLMHWFFYPLLLALMLAGYFISTLDGRPISFFGLFDVPAIYTQKGLESLAGTAHWALAYLTIGLAVFHCAAALWHHYIKKDRVLLRMLKGPDPAN